MNELRHREEADTWDQEVDQHFVNEYELDEYVTESNILCVVGQETTIQLKAKNIIFLTCSQKKNIFSSAIP